MVDSVTPIPANAPPSPPTPPLPESKQHGTSSSGEGVLGESNTGPGVSGRSVAFGGGNPPVEPIMGGRSDGVLGTSAGNGVHGIGGGYGSGVLGENAGGGPGVAGTSTSGDGVFGTGPHNGVHGRSASAGDSGVYGENTGAGYGVGGSSASGNGVIGTAAGAPAGGGQNNGVIGRTTTSDSGVWGDNTGGGNGVTGTSAHGTGVIGQGGWNGVQGSTANSSASGVWGENTGSGYGVGGKSAGGIGVYATGSPAGHFDGAVTINGDLTMSSGNITMSSGGDILLSDCAEYFDVADAEIEPGTVMVIDQDGSLRPSNSPYDKRVAGVVSGAGQYRPGIILGKRAQPDNSILVALLGKVYCKVDASSSPVEVGDLLTTSPIPGHAMRADDCQRASGSVIGKALGAIYTGQGLIPILIALQ